MSIIEITRPVEYEHIHHTEINVINVCVLYISEGILLFAKTF